VTFTIVARSDDTRMFGVAIASSSAAVAAHCSHARAGIGAVATQNITDPILGPRMLDGLRCGATAAEAIAGVLDSTDHGAYRQLLAIGSLGSPAHHCGARGMGLAASAVSQHAVAAGHLLPNRQVPAAMIAAFDATYGHFADRLLAALQAGVAVGGAAAALHSAGLLVVREVPWPIIDLRVDWSDADPIAALDLLWKRYAPQVEESVGQALRPGHSAAAGLPGS
jgi:uncharacterized Ntn-hydrolase superfamily protein